LKKLSDGEKILKEKQKNIDECDKAIAKYNEELNNADKKDESVVKKIFGGLKNLLGLSDPNKDYTPDELKNKLKKVERDTFQLQSEFIHNNKKAEELSNQLKTIELNLNEKKNLLAILKKQKADKEPELEKAKDSVRKETQKYNEQQNEINQYERKVKLAKDDIESIQRDIKLCNTQKEQYTRWISTQN
jgi:chromosome segregation ATPase